VDDPAQEIRHGAAQRQPVLELAAVPCSSDAAARSRSISALNSSISSSGSRPVEYRSTNSPGRQVWTGLPLGDAAAAVSAPVSSA
jgi:hypothetical protein